MVDEYFPVSVNKEAKMELLGCLPNEREIYVMVLEKCWAKLWGSYKKIDGKAVLT